LNVENLEIKCHETSSLSIWALMPKYFAHKGLLIRDHKINSSLRLKNGLLSNNEPLFLSLLSSIAKEKPIALTTYGQNLQQHLK
jgi:hypothetical protein